MKKLGLISALWALFCCPVAFAAGTIPFSLSQQLDEFGKPLANCALYIIQAGTVSTPQNAYQDSSLTLPLPNPIRCDAAGRLVQFFLSDGSIKIRLTKSNGVNVVTADGILVVGASSGGGGGSPVDPTTVIATGDVKVRYGTGVLTGFVRMNGRTLGSATSGATERANADAQALFEYLWGADANLAVSGGRGATANADWTANKTIALPDLRGRGLTALADMGNTAAILTSATCATPTVLGTACGTETKTIGQVNLPVLTWPTTLAATAGSLAAVNNTLAISNTLGLNDTGHAHNYNAADAPSSNFVIGGGSSVVVTRTTGATTTANTSNISLTGGVSLTGSVALTGSPSLTGSITSGGSGTALSSLAPVMLFTVYCKL